MKSPRVHIVLLNWNGWRDTIECLESLLGLNYDNYQILVCDNASTDDSIEKILSWSQGIHTIDTYPVEAMRHLSYPPNAKPVEVEQITRQQALNPTQPQSNTKITLIQNGGNIGFAGGNNSGLRYALNQGTDYCWLLNNDTVVEQNTLCEMVTHSQALDQKGVKNTCGSVQCFYDNPRIIQALGGFEFSEKSAITSATFGRYLSRDDYANINHKEYESRLSAIHGCSWLLSRDYLTEVGLMDDRYFLYYEEIDWALRAKGKFKLTYAPNAFVYHKEGASIGSQSYNRTRSPFAEYNIHKSRLRFCKKHLPTRIIPVTIYSLLQAINRVRQRQFGNSRAIIKAVLGAKWT